MNLTTFRLRISSTTGLASATAGHYEQGLVDGWVNEAIVQFLLRTKAVKKTAVLNLTAGEGDYVLDPDIIALEDLHIGERGLEVVDSGDIRRYRLGQSSSPSGDGVSKYAYEGQVLMLHPTPATPAGQLHIVYVQRPTPLTDGAHDPKADPFGRIPEEYHPVIESYAKWKAAEYANDAPSQNGQTFMQQYETGVISTRTLETRKAGVNVRRARPGWRSSSAGVSPGIDTGA